ncbi:hypothetical protein Tco_0439252 [Tanacetum coccineum]
MYMVMLMMIINAVHLSQEPPGSAGVKHLITYPSDRYLNDPQEGIFYNARTLLSDEDIAVTSLSPWNVSLKKLLCGSINATACSGSDMLLVQSQNPFGYQESNVNGPLGNCKESLLPPEVL